MPYSSLIVRDVVLLCFPPVDAVFAELARREAESMATRDPGKLERSLRSIYPSAVVRERDVLASFGGPAWYIYRDGRYSPFSSHPWWDEPDSAWIVLGDEGHYLDASPTALRMLGVDLDGLRRSSPGAFTVPNHQATVPWILQLLRDTGELHSTSLLRPAGGGPDLPVEYRLVRDGDGPGRHVATMRLVPQDVVETVSIGGLALEGGA